MGDQVMTNKEVYLETFCLTYLRAIDSTLISLLDRSSCLLPGWQLSP